MNKKIFIVTSTFPFFPGEQFLETEVLFWGKQKSFEVILLPSSIGNGKCRKIPNNIHMDLSLAKHRKNEILINLNNYKNELNITSESLLKKQDLINSASMVEFYISFFQNYFKDLNENYKNLIFYTYWHNEISYALSILRKKYKFILVSRIHGNDLYEERKQNNYMPLKREFADEIDLLFFITENQNDYLQKTYNFTRERLVMSRLGVLDNNIKTKTSDQNTFSIASCSYIVQLKRIDRIIKSLKILSNNEKINIKWFHIGDGPLKNELVSFAQKTLEGTKNIGFKFIGELDNDKVFKFYNFQKIDVFINTSESEGMPVSIMEALSCSIPVIAPNVGGISESITTGYNGILLSKEPAEAEIASSLSEINFLKNPDTRSNAYEVFRIKFDAKKNYINHINMIKNIS